MPDAHTQVNPADKTEYSCIFCNYGVQPCVGPNTRTRELVDLNFATSALWDLEHYEDLSKVHLGNLTHVLNELYERIDALWDVINERGLLAPGLQSPGSDLSSM